MASVYFDPDRISSSPVVKVIAAPFFPSDAQDDAYKVFARIFFADGTQCGLEWQLPEDVQGIPSCRALSEARFVVTWIKDSQGKQTTLHSSATEFAIKRK